MSDHHVWHHPQLHSRVAGDGSGQTPIIGIRYRIVTKQALESLTKGIRLTPKSTRPRRPFTLSSRLPRSKQGAGIDNQEVLRLTVMLAAIKDMQEHDFDATEQLMPDDYAYEHFDLKNKELTYAVDDSNLNCRLNGWRSYCRCASPDDLQGVLC